MKRVTLLFLIATAALAAGCSNDDKKPTNPGNHENTPTTVWVENGGYWRATVDATDYDAFTGYSFADKDTVPAPAKTSAWDIAFEREVVKLNGGSSGTAGVEGADLGAVDYAAVGASAADTTDWTSDSVYYKINQWYNYNPQTHEFSMTRNVYAVMDATGQHLVKFHVDSLTGDLGPGSMGDVNLTYYYQPVANDHSVPGPTQTAVVHVGTGAGFFDFSSGQQVTPADPAHSLDWDLEFSNFSIAQNSGPSGSGQVAEFDAFTTLGDPTDIDAFTEQPVGAPFFTDIPGSALTDWYDYNEQTHQLSSKNHVYLIRQGDRLYKMKILGYYADVQGVPVSAIYTFIWNEL